MSEEHSDYTYTEITTVTPVATKILLPIKHGRKIYRPSLGGAR